MDILQEYICYRQLSVLTEYALLARISKAAKNNLKPNNLIVFALVAESVDASDLKSDWAHPQCQFKSGSGQTLKDSRKRVFFRSLTFTSYFYALRARTTVYRSIFFRKLTASTAAAVLGAFDENFYIF